MSDSGDRHLRPEPSGKLKELVAGPRAVVVRATGAYAETFAGQVLLQMLVNLLSRQFGVLETIWLDIPLVTVDLRAFPLAPAASEDLMSQLRLLGLSVGGREVQVKPYNSAVQADVAVLVGPSLPPRSTSPLTLVAYGDGWDAFCSSTDPSPYAPHASVIPFGPLLAACLASSRVFLHFYQITDLPTADRSLWAFGPGMWSALSEQSGVNSIDLPPAHVIGLGAVGAAFGLALALSPNVTGQLIGLDPQMTDVTGRNRLVSAFYDDLGQSKVALAARLFTCSGIRFYPNTARWPDYAVSALRNAPDEVRREEDAFRYRWVISCVDRNIDRFNIAKYLPLHLLAGSTDGLVAQATYYAMDGPCECLACNHRPPAYDLESYVRELTGLSQADRDARYDAWGLTQPAKAALDEYVSRPECGHVAEAELRRLGVEGATDWSVGFVSVAAGAMLAAYFVRSAIQGVAAAMDEQPERRLVFLNAQEFSISRARRKDDCPLCADPTTRQRFVRRWGH